MDAILQALFSGLALGSIYALVAVGFSITYGTTRTFNFGQGEFLSVGTVIAVSAMLLLSGHDIHGALAPDDVTLPRLLAALLVSMALLGLLGIALYHTAVRPFVGAGGLAWVMSTLGFGIIIQNAALAVWGPSAIVVPSILGNDVVRIAGAGVLPQELLVLATSLVVLLALDVVMRRTKFGKAVRAVAHSKAAATLMGINVGAVIVTSFFISSSLAGLAGLMIAPITTASVFMGLSIALKAFSAAIVGGLGNARGCILGGLLLGVLESGVGLWQAELREISIFVLIILVLVVRPEGLLGQRVAEKV